MACARELLGADISVGNGQPCIDFSVQCPK